MAMERQTVNVKTAAPVKSFPIVSKETLLSRAECAIRVVEKETALHKMMDQLDAGNQRDRKIFLSPVKYHSWWRATVVLI